MVAYLVVSTLVWLPYGIYCFAQPQILGEFAGLAATSGTAVAEVRAMYGGLQVAIGALAGVALLREALRRHIIFSLAVLTAGLGIARLLAVFLGAGLSGYTAGALVFEFGATAWAVMLLRS